MTEVLPSKHYSHSPEYSSSNSSNSQPPSDDDESAVNTISPLISHDRRLRTAGEELEQHDKEEDQNRAQLSVLALLLAAFRKSLVTCRADREDSSSCSMEISWPTNVRHVAHVTFDRYNGFLGLPVEFELEVPRRVPSASASVFGVSAESMQCSYDSKGNSVPTILLLMQQRLYAQGGLKAEGIFRINAENSQEEHVRNQLNKGIVPHDIDLHCLAGLIKAWFRELPRGVLDSLTPEQVMQCNTEEECLELVNLLPPTQAGLLNWAINLMADVVQEEQFNKMNSRNIAMVFAPNMTQMADPLTALMYAVQVMNFLKTLIQRTLRERQEAALDPISVSSCRDPHDDNGHDNVSNGLIRNCEESDGIDEDERARGSVESFVESYGTGNQSVNDIEESFLTFQSVNDIEESFLTFSEKDTIDEGELPHDSRVDNFSSSDSPGNEMKKSGGAKLEVVDSDDNLGVKKGTQMSYSENNHWKASTSECDSFGIHEVKYNSFQRNNVEINKGVRKDYPQCMIQVLQPTEKPKGISVINHINQQVERAEAWR